MRAGRRPSRGQQQEMCVPRIGGPQEFLLSSAPQSWKTPLIPAILVVSINSVVMLIDSSVV
jgi:hypothetical protein